ncbi:MAG: chemotaxis protein CheA [Thiotrichales bacterium]
MEIDLSPALQTFTVESRELLEEMERSLLEMESGGVTTELIHSVFRAAHTIKGSSGLFGQDAVVAFTHDVESVLDSVRDGRLAMDAGLIGLFLECRDHIAALVDAALDGGDTTALRHGGDALQARLRHYLAAELDAPETASNAGIWHISLRCGQDLLRDGMDPLGILRYLATLGTLSNVTTLGDQIPAAGEMDPESCYLGFEMDLETNRDASEIEEAFSFIRASSQVHILPPRRTPKAWAELIHALPEADERIGEILVKSGAITRIELATALGAQVMDESHAPIGEILVKDGVAPRAVVTAALDKQAAAVKMRGERYVRVEATKLDRLITLVGELVLASAVTELRALESGDQPTREAVVNAARFVEEVRDAALGLRMVQIGETFNRFQRVVRDLSHELDKQIELIITGGDAELDKTVVERIGDPLTHLVRNAIDHGVEASAARVAAGKPATGQLRLNAYHETGSIVIEVVDDGRGLDRAKIIDKAIARGVIASGDGMSDGDIYRLIFEPGFSTAEQVTNLSGRGVGMDAVRRAVEDLRGTVEVESEAGQGTMVRLRLPLTLAIIEGFLMAVGDQRFIVPLEMVDECVELTDAGHHDYLDLRGEVLPFLRLRELFQSGGRSNDRQSVVVVNFGGKKAGLVVDRLLGDLQTVIKPLGRIFSPIKWVSGCTVLGSGDVGLILDVPELVARVEREHLPLHLARH